LTGAILLAHAASKMKHAARRLSGGDTIELGNTTVTVFDARGHTPDCQALLVEGRVFTGDALFVGGAGRTDFAGGSAADLFETFRRYERTSTFTIFAGGGVTGSRAIRRRWANGSEASTRGNAPSTGRGSPCYPMSSLASPVQPWAPITIRVHAMGTRDARDAVVASAFDEQPADAHARFLGARRACRAGRFAPALSSAVGRRAALRVHLAKRDHGKPRSSPISSSILTVVGLRGGVAPVDGATGPTCHASSR
jgi:hypothetical protein